MATTGGEPTTEPVTDPATEPTTDPAAEPAIEPAAEPRPATEPETDVPEEDSMTLISRKLLPTTLALTALVGFAAGYGRQALADKPKPAAGGVGGAAGSAAPTNCKAFGSGKCCDPAVTAHLSKESVFKACGESDATFLGEVGSKETCKYVFQVAGEKPDDTFVQVYAPAQKEVPTSPNDPFFQWKKVGKAFLTEKAKSPKAAPMMVNSTGLWMPGKGYFVSVNASTKVCTKAEATKLAPNIK